MPLAKVFRQCQNTAQNAATVWVVAYDEVSGVGLDLCHPLHKKGVFSTKRRTNSHTICGFGAGTEESVLPQDYIPSMCSLDISTQTRWRLIKLG